MKLSIVRSLRSGLTLGAFVFAAFGNLQNAAAHGSWPGSSTPTTTFTLGQITIQNAGTADISGNQTLTGSDGSSLELTLTQGDNGSIVGTASLTVGGETYGPIDIAGRIKSSSRGSRFCLGGQLEQDLGLCDDDDDDDSDEDSKITLKKHWGGHDDGDDDEEEDECDDELTVRLRIRGYQTTTSLTVSACASVDGPEQDAKAKLTGTITVAATATTSTILIADAQSVKSDDWGVQYESERNVTVDGVSVGIAFAEQTNYKNYIRFSAETDEDEAQEFEVRLYGVVENGVFTPVAAKLESASGRSCVPASAITVLPSASLPLASDSEDSDDDDDGDCDHDGGHDDHRGHH